MQTVILEGELGNRFGRRWNTNCDKLIDIFKLIECQREGFRQYMMECSDAGIQFDIKRGEDYLEDESELLLKLNNDDVVVTPIPAGSKGAAGKLIAAIIIIYAGWALAGAQAGTAAMASAEGISVASAGGTAAAAQYYGGYALMMIGTSLGLRAINEMLAPNPADDDDDDSSLFGGQVNTTQQGVPVPIAYGELIVGGATISAGFTPYLSKAERATTYMPGDTPNEGIAAGTTTGGGYGEGDQELVDETVEVEQEEL